MTVDLWISYLATVSLIVFAPGHSVLLVSSQRMRHGPRATLSTIAGDLSANVAQMSAAGLGLVTIVQNSATLFWAIKWLGVVYLVWLGVQRLRGRDRSGRWMSAGETAVSRWKLYSRGFAVSAANPKAVIFFASMFPLFIVPTELWLPQLIVLGVTFLALDSFALLSYARVGEQLQKWLARRGWTQWEDRVTGSLLMCAGFVLAGKRAG